MRPPDSDSQVGGSYESPPCGLTRESGKGPGRGIAGLTRTQTQTQVSGLTGLRGESGARRLLGSTVDGLASAVRGERDARLFPAVRRLLPLIECGALAESEVMGALETACRDCGLDPALVRAKLDWRRGNPVAGAQRSDWTRADAAPVATQRPTFDDVVAWANRERPDPVRLRAAFAVAYERAGWPTLPWRFVDGAKRPVVVGWPERQADPVRAWLEFTGEFADCQIGVVTGRASGLLVLDDDGYGLPEPVGTAFVRGRRGVHVYLQRPAVRSLRKAVPMERESGRVEALCDGQFVAVPPSVRADGGQYEWCGGVEIAACPSWLVERLRR